MTSYHPDPTTGVPGRALDPHPEVRWAAVGWDHRPPPSCGGSWTPSWRPLRRTRPPTAQGAAPTAADIAVTWVAFAARPAAAPRTRRTRPTRRWPPCRCACCPATAARNATR
ncbi:hypothetical protein NKH77_02465 [Streptomyces sp. M19]